jgi:hypothetical protein
MAKQVGYLITEIDFDLELYLSFHYCFVRVFVLFRIRPVLHEVFSFLFCVSFG